MEEKTETDRVWRGDAESVEQGGMAQDRANHFTDT